MKEDNIKVLFDSNIIIDIFTNRDGAKDSIECLMKMASGDFTGYVLSKQITDIYYVLRKYFDSERRKEIIAQLLLLFEVLDTSKDDILTSLIIDGPDLEDNILISALGTNSIDYLITKNIKDFSNYRNKCKLPKEIIEAI